ncbi:GGDEF domain-containing protein [Erythrobacter sp. SCSIO 43205]|uniref:GGDEF domain-containing protein n=1 Tax=Erythrobacter sp. SCSIO 43205 TaxID=2779361 RepID=UPI001CA81401|nr:GGDEF domain-containing protein [Erythrobacter sp. SCSIO 43205]UAB79543.1 GGDEF domain-containing protein [Erythrobacter sp. SCSIO 43205]
MTFIFATAFLVIWARDKSRAENLALSLGWLLLTSGFSISILSPSQWGRAIPAITYAPYALSAIAMSWGVLTRVGAKPPVAAQLWIAFTGFATLMLVQNIGGSIVADLYVTNLACAAIFILTAQLFAQSAGRDLVERYLLVMLILNTAQLFIRPVISVLFDGPILEEAYRESTYYFAFNWIFAFGSVLFGLALIAGSVKDQVAALHHRTSRDALSGLLMRGEFEAQVEHALTRSNGEGITASLVIGDLDHFKQVNDIWGHQVGDGAIASFGKMVSKMIRPSDIAGRIGGEEFCVLVWNADETIAARLAHRLKSSTKTLEISNSALDVRLTASFGVAEQMRGENYRSLFARADKALYAAKQAGRDCVERASEEMSQNDVMRAAHASDKLLLNQDLTPSSERYAG